MQPTKEKSPSEKNQKNSKKISSPLIWFIEEWVLHGKSHPACNARIMTTQKLAKIDLLIHQRKCELYLPVNSRSPARFGSIPVVRGQDMWSHLGTPVRAGCQSPRLRATTRQTSHRQANQASPRLIPSKLFICCGALRCLQS